MKNVNDYIFMEILIITLDDRAFKQSINRCDEDMENFWLHNQKIKNRHQYLGARIIFRKGFINRAQRSVGICRC